MTPTARPNATADLHRQLDVLEGRAEEPKSRAENIGTIVLGNISSCVFFAAVCAVWTGVCTYAGWWVLQQKEPYANNYGIVWTAPFGAAIISVPFYQVWWVYNKLEAWYEAKHRIYEPPKELPRWWTSQQRDTYVSPPPKLAHRYSGTVIVVCTIAGLLSGGLLGPMLATKLHLDNIDDQMTVLAATRLGGVGTGIITGFLVIALSTSYGTWSWCAEKEYEL
ncbi:hypothetical protein EVJ58_g2505 [Rhodofomes roseus]|uniref:Uncharacterized protein n=1 Tax=Rhodofomes roseus TaxID=34475 RepID=A0A4Y9YSE1_9APHY|nr:hypothetical protein EVJ58_g2505 [Rhodofomes roseus]